MTVEILRTGPLTAQQVLAKVMDQVEADDSVIVVVFKEKTATMLLNYSYIRPSELALAAVELAEEARQHARKP